MLVLSSLVTFVLESFIYTQSYSEQIWQVFSSSNVSLSFFFQWPRHFVRCLMSKLTYFCISSLWEDLCLLQYSLQTSVLSSKFVKPHYIPAMNYKTRIPSWIKSIQDLHATWVPFILTQIPTQTLLDITTGFSRWLPIQKNQSWC